MAGWTSTSASRHRGHNHRKNSHSRRSAGRKRRFERARTPSWWRRARVSSRRSLRVTRAERTAAPVLKRSRIARRVPSEDANVNDSCPDAILARHSDSHSDGAGRSGARSRALSRRHPRRPPPGSPSPVPLPPATRPAVHRHEKSVDQAARRVAAGPTLGLTRPRTDPSRLRRAVDEGVARLEAVDLELANFSPSSHSGPASNASAAFAASTISPR